MGQRKWIHSRKFIRVLAQATACVASSARTAALAVDGAEFARVLDLFNFAISASKIHFAEVPSLNSNIPCTRYTEKALPLAWRERGR